MLMKARLIRHIFKDLKKPHNSFRIITRSVEGSICGFQRSTNETVHDLVNKNVDNFINWNQNSISNESQNATLIRTPFYLHENDGFNCNKLVKYWLVWQELVTACRQQLSIQQPKPVGQTCMCRQPHVRLSNKMGSLLDLGGFSHRFDSPTEVDGYLRTREKPSCVDQQNSYGLPYLSSVNNL